MNAGQESVAIPVAPGRELARQRLFWKKLKDAAVALSLANLCLVRGSFGLLYSLNQGYFEEAGITGPKLVALSVNILLLTAAAWVGLQLWRRWRPRWPAVVLELLFLGLLLMPVDFCRTDIFEIPDYALMRFLLRPWVAAILLTLIGVVVWKRRPVARVAAVCVGILVPLALFALARTAVLGVELARAPRHADPVMAPLLPVAQERPRVVWIIFDETDQRLAFDQRPAKVRLPEFDRFRGESLYATNAFPPGANTIVSVPALISGRRLANAKVGSRSDLILTQAGTGAQTNWSGLPSVFDSARELGLNSAVVGWYHPYARVLNRSLSFCSWYSYYSLDSERRRDTGTLGDLMIEQLMRCSLGMFYRRHAYGELCRSILADSVSVVTNEACHLIYLHLPGPHGPGVYRPEKDAFTSWGMAKATGYFNNLVLADHHLGKLRRALERQGQWDKTWVLVSADHSWRQSAVYDGRRDLRVPFLLKAPGQNLMVTFSPRINTVLTHDLILAILSGKLTNQRDAATWLAQHPSDESDETGNGPVRAPLPSERGS